MKYNNYFQLNPSLILVVVGFFLFSFFFNFNILSAYAEKIFNTCNCMLDSIYQDTMVGLTLPKVNIIKTESITSQTEGNLNWNAIKSAPMFGIKINDFFITNLTKGTAATVALNTININRNETLGMEIIGGAIPEETKLEILHAAIQEDGRLYDSIVQGEKLYEYSLDTTNKSVQFNFHENGTYLLLIELKYNNINSGSVLTAIYELILKVA